MCSKTECSNGTCTTTLTISTRRSYEIPKDKIGPMFATRLKSSPNETYRGLGFNIESREIDEKSRTVLFVASTSTPDRYDDVIEQDGWQLENYRKNPVGLFAHDSSALPVARGLKTEVKGGKLLWTAQFPTREESAFADTVFQLVKGGYLNAVSVGFVPLQFKFPGEPGGLPDGGLLFTKTELLEISIVPVPANPEALVVGKKSADFLTSILNAIDATPEDDFLARWVDETVQLARAANFPIHSVDDLISVCGQLKRQVGIEKCRALVPSSTG